MANTGLGVTIGSHSLRGVLLKKKGEGFVVQRVFSDRLSEENAAVAGRALAAKGLKGVPATLGLTGRDVIIRYSQIPPVPEWRLRNLMKFEVEEVSAQSGGDVSADFRTLTLPDPEGTRDDDTVLVALARNRYLDKRIKALGTGGIKLGEATPNSIALFNAFAVNATYRDDETALLVNIGAENVDIALQRGGELLFARNATPGGQAFTAAIETAFGAKTGKAEQMKRAKADVTPKGQARYPGPTEEKVANAIMGVAGQLSSMIQSTLMIARAQTRMPELKVDRVLLSGGGATLKGIDLYLKQAMGVPVERFDPFDLCDTSALSDDQLAQIESAPHEFAVAVGLAQNALSPAAFHLAVLPEKLKKARDFATKGIWAAAAGLAALGILFLIYKDRNDAVAKIERQRKAVKKETQVTQREDQRLRGALAKAQEMEVKHRFLADVATPGAFFAQVLQELEAHATPHIFLKNLRLNVDRSGNNFSYWVPKSKGKANGYVPSSRSFQDRRFPSVTVDGLVSGGEKPAALARAYVSALRANDKGLVVETVKRFKEGRSGKPGTFQLRIEPAWVLDPSDEEARTHVLKHLRAIEDDEGEPVFEGRRLDGVLMRVPQAQVSSTALDRIKGQLDTAGE